MVPVVSMVTETATGNLQPNCSNARSMPIRPAFTLRVSWQVSSSR